MIAKQGLGSTPAGFQVSYIQYQQNMSPSQNANASSAAASAGPGQVFDRVLWATYPSGQVPQWYVLDANGNVIAQGGNVSTSVTPLGYGGQVMDSSGTSINVPAGTTYTPPDVAPVNSVSPSTQTTSQNPSVPSVNATPSTSVQAQGATSVSGFSLPDLSFNGFSSTEVYLGLGAVAVILLMMSQERHHRG